MQKCPSCCKSSYMSTSEVSNSSYRQVLRSTHVTLYLILWEHFEGLLYHQPGISDKKKEGAPTEDTTCIISLKNVSHA